MKFGVFYELSVPQAVGPRGRAPGVHERARAGPPGRRARLPLGVGRRAPLPRGVLALLGARAVPHRLRRCRRRTSASATASSSASRSSTTRCASPSGPRCSTSSPAAGSSSAPAARPRGPSSAASAPIPDTTKKSWDEYVHTIPQMWMNERFGYEGEFFSMPTRAVLPKPYQKPHPPMWVAVSSPGTEFDAADRGMGALGVNFTTFKAQEQRVQEYRGAHPALHAGRRVRQRPAGRRPTSCSATRTRRPASRRAAA